jgi:hypothetical protein
VKIAAGQEGKYSRASIIQTNWNGGCSVNQIVGIIKHA